MKILGLNLGYMATASIYIDGAIRSCISQERFSRRKNDESYPREAIEYCFQHAAVRSGDEIDVVAVGSVQHDLWHRLAHYYSGFDISDRVEEQHIYWKPVLCDGEKIAWQDLYADRLDFNQYPGTWKQLANELSASIKFTEDDQRKINNHIVRTIADHTQIPRDRFRFVDHHAAHAAYAYYASPYRAGKTLVLTLDAFGDGNSASISIGNNGRLERVKTISHSDFQVARIYRYITLLLGMRPDEHEYKVMGLAAYAKPQTYKKAYDVFRNTMYVDGLDFKFHTRPSDLYHYFREKLEGIRFDGVAGGLQKYVEELICEWVKNVVVHYGIGRIVLAGGVVMNIKATQRLSELDCVDAVFVPPSPGDESLGMGAAYHCAAELGESTIHPLANAYLGTNIEEGEVQALLTRIRTEQGARYKVINDVSPAIVATQLARGRVVGRCGGRMEFGARSLGNRSIIADARSDKMIRMINDKIKNRDFWMPFAPAILKERANDYLVNPKNLPAPYMTIAFETKEISREHLAAAIHPVDYSARPQLVDKEQNPDLHALITAFETLTGVGGVLNTSFNLHGEPIVRTAEDAYRVFELTDIDDLWVGRALISKK
jgi:carbamoyltransferase